MRVGCQSTLYPMWSTFPVEVETKLCCSEPLHCCYYCQLGCIQPKYIGHLLKAAEQRKRDMERRIEKTVQKEREAEKDLFDDKEAFVTDAYRRKMEEIRQEEERERKQEELEGIYDFLLVNNVCLFVALWFCTIQFAHCIVDKIEYFYVVDHCCCE